MWVIWNEFVLLKMIPQITSVSKLNQAGSEVTFKYCWGTVAHILANFQLRLNQMHQNDIHVVSQSINV